MRDVCLSCLRHGRVRLRTSPQHIWQTYRSITFVSADVPYTGKTSRTRLHGRQLLEKPGVAEQVRSLSTTKSRWKKKKAAVKVVKEPAEEADEEADDDDADDKADTPAAKKKKKKNAAKENVILRTSDPSDRKFVDQLTTLSLSQKGFRNALSTIRTALQWHIYDEHETSVEEANDIRFGEWPYTQAALDAGTIQGDYKDRVVQFLDQFKEAKTGPVIKLIDEVLEREMGGETEQLLRTLLKSHAQAREEQRQSEDLSSKIRLTESRGPAMTVRSIVGPSVGREPQVAKLDEANVKTLYAEETTLQALPIEEVDVRSLSFDLQRVLFNPGVYQLQDPRSRVYNFDPYLEKIMPVTEFDFDALSEYVTSSEDKKLCDLAKQVNKRYIGSSSSMTGILSHFHFLLSAFRELDMKNLSRGFKADSFNFTKLTTSPVAVFLRWRDGVYATDADKEHDEGNILMSMGKSIEKLLTLEKDAFERYRKSSRGEVNLEAEKPEQYHYGTIGNVLMRSQLDAHDPRLPGTGMFDLKTRAVAAIRMYLSDHEKGQGYQIKGRFGTWESFEREYYDMMRAAFLKYMLQVRMGRMDGIFVAYHNIERMFGFQYVSLPEMDEGLHGQSDTTLGDREFGLSVRMLEDVFDQATQRFPEQTLRFHFEAREATEKLEPVTYMNIFAEPMTDEEVDRIQEKTKAELAEYERRLFSGESTDSEAGTTVESDPDDVSESASEEEHTSLENAEDADPSLAEETKPISTIPLDNAATEADTAFLDSLSDLESAEGSGESEEVDAPKTDGSGEDITQPLQGVSPTAATPLVLGMRVVVRHKVNGQYVGRPVHLSEEDEWVVDYTIEEMPATQARAKYTLCKNRRSNAFKTVRKSEDSGSPGSFITHLLNMSEQGREWRRRRDELDAKKDRVTLYESSTIDETSDVQQLT